jgi:MSHA biogenesis protein MshK
MKPLLLLYLCLINVQAGTLQDPTKPSPNKSIFNTEQDLMVMAPMTLKLTAIINNNKNRRAIINGRSVSQGQEIQGYKVILISQNHVILNSLDSSDGKQTLFVNDNNIIKDVNHGF